MQTIVYKVGSRMLADESGRIDEANFTRLVSEAAAVWRAGHQVVLVSSGAVAVGAAALGEYPKSIVERQAAAAVGQARLMHKYQDLFDRHGITIAQVLLTRGELHNRTRFLNARNTLQELARRRILPIINENDTVAVDEIIVGDNDQLAAITSFLVNAQLCVLLTDVDGVLRDTRDPQSLVPEFRDVEEAKALVVAKTSQVSTGGMTTKLLAAKMNSDFGISTLIANGRTEGILPAVAEGTARGTRFLPRESPRSAWQYWLRHGAMAEGDIAVDAGAASALRQGKSLLPGGIQNVSGSFDAGATVTISTLGRILARGVALYSSDEITRLRGTRTSQIEATLGYTKGDEIVHRNDMVLED